METESSFLDYSFINFANTESLLNTSQYAKVIFHNIEEKYNCQNDLICQYSLTEQFNAQSGDRIILFKLGWQQVTDYVLFEWIPFPHASSTLQVRFKSESLPQDENEFYQLCYISGENSVCGASIPFQFTNVKDNLVTTSTDSECFVSLQIDGPQTLDFIREEVTSSSSLTESKQEETFTNITDSTSKDVKQLIEENKELKNQLQNTNASLQHCDNEISELKLEILNLKDMLRVTQSDVSDLQARMNIANDEYKKMYAEKARVEKKYEKLVKKCQSKVKKTSESSSSSELSSDFLAELQPLPPFPILM